MKGGGDGLIKVSLFGHGAACGLHAAGSGGISVVSMLVADRLGARGRRQIYLISS